MKVLLVLLKGFEHMESSAFIDVMGWAKTVFNCEIELETCGFHKQVSSSFSGVPVLADKLIENVNADDYDALAIPGGSGALAFYKEAYKAPFLELIRGFHEKKKLIAAVCVGSLPLGKSGILKGRNATTYHLDEGRKQKHLEKMGVNILHDRIVVDETIITSYCPETAAGVAFQLLEMLTSREQAEKVKEAMGYE